MGKRLEINVSVCALSVYLKQYLYAAPWAVNLSGSIVSQRMRFVVPWLIAFGRTWRASLKAFSNCRFGFQVLRRFSSSASDRKHLWKRCTRILEHDFLICMWTGMGMGVCGLVIWANVAQSHLSQLNLLLAHFMALKFNFPEPKTCLQIPIRMVGRCEGRERGR